MIPPRNFLGVVLQARPQRIYKGDKATNHEGDIFVKMAAQSYDLTAPYF